MATTTWNCNKDAVTADNGTSLGAGAMDYLPIGNYAGYDYRAFLGFSYSFSGMVSITSAILHMKTTGQVKVAFGSDPDVDIRRINGTWSEGTATSLSGSNAIERSNEPGVTGSTVTWDITTSENTWDTVDITTIIQEAFAATDFDGLRLVAATSATSDVTEFYSREYGSNDAYIVVTYTTNTLPSAPTLGSPSAGATAQSLTPTFTFTHNDAESDACASYDIQVSTDSTFVSVTHWNGSNLTSGISGDNISVAYAGSALSNNTAYYWRARTNDGTGDGTWTGARTFTTAKLPTATLTTPSSSGVFAKLTKGTPGWAAPRINVGWTFACGDSGTQSSYQVVITQSSTGAGGSYSAFEDSGTVSSTSTSFVSDATVTNGYHYKVKVRVTCSHGQTSSYTSEYIAKTVWAVALHRFDCTSAPVSWSVGSIGTTELNGSDVVLEYGSNSTTTTPSTFYSSVSSLTLARYFFYRAYLLPAYNTASTTWPSLNNLTLTYSTTALSPDHWTRPDTTNQTIDTAEARSPGAKSLKLTGTGSAQAVSQIVEVQPNTDYILSGWMKAQGAASAVLALSESTPTGTYVSQDTEFPMNSDTDWTHVKTPVWNSGASTSVYVLCRMAGAASTYAWFDDIKLEASTVATQFSPAGHNSAAVIDGGGVIIDASVTAPSGSAAAVFRLKGSTGGTGDTVALGTHGLDFGTTGTIRFEGSDDVSLSSTTHAFQIGPSSGVNLAMDTNEIMARNNGAASELYLNRDGGDVYIGAPDAGDGLHLRGNGAIEISDNGGTPYIDFKNAYGDDFDARIILSDNDTLQVDGAHFDLLYRLRMTGTISPTALAANTNDWNPTGLSTANVIRIGSDATPRNLTGIVAGTAGDILLLHNRNNGTAITLVHDATSTAANRFLCPGAANYTLSPKSSVWLYYSGTDSRWLVI